MEDKEDIPLYNIGVVTRLTNISPATLRAWERRYDFPKARRSQGGHRLYTGKDILRLQWVKQMVNGGMQTAQAIQALRHQEKIGQMPSKSQPSVSKAAGMAEQISHSTLQNRLLEVLLSGDFQSADRIFSETLIFHPPEEVILEVITPVLDRIGQSWAEKEISVADEHMTSNYLRQRLLLWMLASPPPIEIRPIVLACAPEELHDGSLLIFGTLLRRKRYPVLYLGASVPLADLAEFVQEVNPSLVVLVAMTEETARNLLNWKSYLPESAMGGSPLVGFGGRVFLGNSDLKNQIGGIYLGDDFNSGIETVEKLLSG